MGSTKGSRFFPLSGNPPPSPLAKNHFAKKSLAEMGGTSPPNRKSPEIFDIFDNNPTKGLRLAFLEQKCFFLAFGGTPPPQWKKSAIKYFAASLRSCQFLQLSSSCHCISLLSIPTLCNCLKKNLFCCLSSRARQFNFASIQRMAAPNWNNNGGIMTTFQINLVPFLL